MTLYIKNKNNEFVEIEINSVMNKDLNNKLVIVRVGTDDQPASLEDLDLTVDSFAKADVLDELDNVSVIITPYQIDIDLIDEDEIDKKTIFLQVRSGDNISTLDEVTKAMYKKLKKVYDNVIVLPIPLTVKDYKQVKDTLKRCKMRKKRRSRM